MRLRLKERFICCLLAVTVLLTGICTAAKPTDSYFVCASRASGYPCTFANPSSIADTEMICEPVTLQKNQTIEIGNGRKRLAERRCSDSFMLSGEIGRAHV